MAKLLLSLDGNLVKEFRLTRSRTTIGRRPHNDIQIDNLAVSGDHAAVEVVGQLYFIDDLNSTNGTLLNGEAITRRHPLKNGDEIAIGRYKITFWREPAAAAKQAEFEKTMVMQASPVVAPSPAASTKPAAVATETEAGPEAVIRILTGQNAGKELLLNKPLTTLGKAGVQVVAFRKRDNGYYIAHVEGDQRPMVNSREISDKPHLLAEEDLIEILGVRMAFFFR
ncbi:FHA domain-containing protein [Chitinibacter tainanensis]|uniref:FHA domain-containing protein n=1 Tax=Chitinibacter tainanensis TaxID=230667 RepID=UPI0023573C4C|nr:FHA domain-containing protein [Chitinibacter tainanensis]